MSDIQESAQRASDAALAAGSASTALISTALGVKLLGMAGIFGAGVVGAACIAAFDPPESKKMLFTQAAVAGTSSIFFGPAMLAITEHYFTYVDWTHLVGIELMQYAAPVFLLTGAMSWGLFGMLSRLRHLIARRGAQILGDKLGVDTRDTDKMDLDK